MKRLGDIYTHNGKTKTLAPAPLLSFLEVLLPRNPSELPLAQCESIIGLK